MVESKILLKNGSRSSAAHSGVEAYPKMISIITPSYNQGPFIEETIQSVLFQRGEFYIDYIIMDGYSTDQSVGIIKKYEDLLKKNCSVIEKDDLNYYVKKKDDFLWNHCLGISFRWISETDRGQVDALKKGFRMARGDIYCWLNSDDIYVQPDVLQKVCTYFEKEPDLKLLLGDGPFISKTGKETGIHHVDKINLKELLYLDYHILQPSSFFHKDIYNETHLDEQLICAFDADFFIRMLYNGVKYKKVNDHFAAFRLYEENKTLRLTKTRCNEQVQIACKHSQNRFYLIVSMIYRKIRGIYETRFNKKKPFVWLWIIVRRICYKLVTGKWKPGDMK
jgi:glycosyltransferase involved in cell wall biosynthesis